MRYFRRKLIAHTVNEEVGEQGRPGQVVAYCGYGTRRSVMPTLESKIEKQFALMVRARGGIAVKLAPTIAGIPDRMVLWPGGRFHLVELKTKTGNLRPIQIHRHKELLEMGHVVVVLRGEADIVSWIDEVTLI